MKKLTKKQLQDAKVIIDSLRSNRVSDQEIYNELRQQFDDKKTIYNLIAGTATEELKDKYRILNNILIAVLIVSVLLRLLFVWFLCLSNKTNIIASLILGLLLMGLPIFFTIEVARYKGRIYKILGLLFVANFFNHLGYILEHIKYNGNIDCLLDIFSLVTAIFGAILSFCIAKKVFPNFKIFKSKDGLGEYIIG